MYTMNNLQHMKKRVSSLMMGLLAVGLTMSCSDNDGPTVEEVVDPEFAVIVGTDNGRYMLPIEDLMTGIISPVGKGTNVSDILTWEENLMQKGRDIYHVDPNSNKFGKYRFEDGVLKIIQEIPFSHIPSLYL